LLAEGGGGIGNHRQARICRRAGGERPCHPGKLSSAFDGRAKLSSMPREERGRRRGNEEQLRAGACSRSARARPPWGRRFFEDHVHVGAAEAERAHARTTRSRGFPWPRLAGQEEGPAVELELRVLLGNGGLRGED